MDDTRTLFRKKQSRNKRVRRQIEKYSRNSTSKNKRIWGICHYLRQDNGCQNCPEWEDHAPYGIGQRFCYGLAEECLRVATGEWPVDDEGYIIRKYISRNSKAANMNKKCLGPR